MKGSPEGEGVPPKAIILKTFPEGCFKLILGEKTIGYLNSEIWHKPHSMEINRKASLYHDPSGKQIYISALGILPSFQGRGLGKFFLKDFIKKMRTKKFHSICLRPAKKALSFYARLGFRQTGHGEDATEQYDILELSLTSKTQ